MQFFVHAFMSSSAPVEKGVYVLFCPPLHFNQGEFELAKDRRYIGAGFCPGGYGYMMKRVLAATNGVCQATCRVTSIKSRRFDRSRPVASSLRGTTPQDAPTCHRDAPGHALNGLPRLRSAQIAPASTVNAPHHV